MNKYTYTQIMSATGSTGRVPEPGPPAGGPGAGAPAGKCPRLAARTTGREWAGTRGVISAIAAGVRLIGRVVPPSGRGGPLRLLHHPGKGGIDP